MNKPALAEKLNGCSVLPPMESDRPRTPKANKKPKGKAEHRTTGERFATINAFTDVTLGSLDRAEIAVWLLLWRDTKPDGLARTSQADLARRAGAAIRTVERVIVRLQKAGLLTVVYRGGIGRGPSTYRVHPCQREK